MNPSLVDALRVEPSACTAFVGAGGKTTALFLLARQMKPPVIVTATSHLGAWQLGLADQHIMTDTAAPLEELEHGLTGITLVTGGMDADRSRPLNNHVVDWLHQFCIDRAIPLLLEADGSRQKPLKAWADHEPPLPSFAKQVVQVVGLSGLGKPLGDKFVHRPEIFSQISGLPMGAPITADALIHVLLHHEAGLKNFPRQAHRVVLLNQADTPRLQSMANQMVRPLLSVFDSVIISSLDRKEIRAIHESIAGIVLAAGESTRYGQVKQVLDWHGEPFVRAAARTALAAGLSPVIVITGANAAKIEQAIQGLDVKIVHNANWKSGQGSSISAGISSLIVGTQPGGAIFLLADQPQVTTSIIRALTEKHAEGLYPIVAPLVMDQRANPILFDRITFKDLLSLEGDVGGRAIFHKHHIEYLPWHDERLLMDVDTPEMYQRLMTDDTT